MTALLSDDLITACNTIGIPVALCSPRSGTARRVVQFRHAAWWLAHRSGMGLTCAEIARQVNCDASTVSDAIRRMPAYPGPEVPEVQSVIRAFEAMLSGDPDAEPPSKRETFKFLAALAAAPPAFDEFTPALVSCRDRVDAALAVLPLSYQHLCSSSRHPQVVACRKIFCWLVRGVDETSWGVLAKVLRRSVAHSTICERVHEMVAFPGVGNAAASAIVDRFEMALAGESVEKFSVDEIVAAAKSMRIKGEVCNARVV